MFTKSNCMQEMRKVFGMKYYLNKVTSLHFGCQQRFHFISLKSQLVLDQYKVLLF